MKNEWKFLFLLPFAATAIGCADGAFLPLEVPDPPAANPAQPPANEPEEPAEVPPEDPPNDGGGGNFHPEVYHRPEVTRAPEWELELAPSVEMQQE